MNLEQAMTMAQLYRPETAVQSQETKTRARLEVAEKVFEIAARGGQPYENVGPETWAGKWLPSKSFVLMEIRPTEVAVPYANRINSNKVQHTLSASVEDIEPIVVDMNINNIGSTTTGYVPKIIVVDGKNRHRAQVMQGRDRIFAWVGNLAAAELMRRNKRQKKIRIAAASPEYRAVTRLESLTLLAMAPVIRQDAGDGGSRPTGANAPKVTARGGSLGGGSGMNPMMRQSPLEAQNGARSSGQLSDPDPSDTKVPPDPSDSGQSVDPSDRLQWKANDPQFCAPGCEKDHEHNYGNPENDSPGSGVGPGLGSNNGAHNSAQSKKIVAHGTPEGNVKAWNTRGRNVKRPHLSDTEMEAGPIKVKRIVTSPKKKQMKARDFSQARRKKLAKKGDALPGGGFPIVNRSDLANAKRAIGRAKNRAATIRHINKRAKALGAPGVGQEMEAVSPPGFKYTVEHMKKHSDITNPFALAWWEKNRGDVSHIHKPGRKKSK